MGWDGHMMESKMSKATIKDFVKDSMTINGHKVIKLIAKGNSHYMLVETKDGDTVIHNTIAYCHKFEGHNSNLKWELMVKDVNPFGDKQTPISLVRGLMKANGSTPELESWITAIKNK